MKIPRADSVGEFILVKLRLFCEKRGSTIRYAALYIHEENRLAERGWCTIITIKNSMLINGALPNGFWAEAMETVNYLWNKLATKTKSHDEVILKEAWTNQRQDLQHVRIFGSLALCNIPEEKRSKLDCQRVWQGIFIRYSPDTTKQVIIASEPYIDESE